MIRSLTALLVLAGLVCACRRGPEPVHPGPVPPAEPYVGGFMPLSHWGVGPIRRDTYFERPVIARLFPKSHVRDAVIQIAADETRDAIIVEHAGLPMLEIDDFDGPKYAPGTDDPLIGNVRLVGGPVLGPAGETLGMGWKAAGFDLSQCEVGTGRQNHAVVCARRGEGAITYVFAVPGWDSIEFPPRSRLRDTAYLREIVWTPPPGRR
jgi:hypothetical protein